MALLDAPSEEAVARIIEGNDVLADDANWRPYGGPTHAGVIFNQQSNPISALADKIINCIDARLMRECLARNLDPEGAAAPPTMGEAVERFFGVKAGDFAEVSEQRRRELARGIILAADGSRDHPN